MKKIFIVLLIIFSIFYIPVVKAENYNEKGKVEVKDRNQLDNIGVNKKWTITEKNRWNVLRTPYVDSSKKIYDFTDILTDSEERILKEKIDEFISKYHTELIIMDYYLVYNEDKQNEDFAADFYDYNDFGLDYPKYDGILLFRNVYEEDPYFDMYTFGDAQLYFSHSDYDYILDNIYYDLKEHNYLNGFTDFIKYVSEKYERGISSELKDYYVDDMGYLHKHFRPVYIIISSVSFVISLWIVCHFINKNKMIKKATLAEDYLNKDSINYKVKNDKLISKHLSSYVMSDSSSSGGGGGYHSSGGSSGGGHSSGGGRHG